MTETTRDPRTRNIQLTVLGLLLLIGIVVAGFVNKISQPRVMTPSELRLNGAFMFDTPRALPEFSLVDHQGQPFTVEQLRGHWTLVFFGFTHCPDICPTTMAFLGGFMEALQGLPEADDTRVVMVTVDPARDDAERLAQYVPYFNPEFTGVTGDFFDIHRFATALNTPFRKVPGQGEDYQVDHSANLVLINPRGDYHGFFTAPLDLAKLKVTYRSVRAVWER
ncbi:MAG: SCO family protein [Halieaceae bacterium]